MHKSIDVSMDGWMDIGRSACVYVCICTHTYIYIHIYMQNVTPGNMSFS